MRPFNTIEQFKAGFVNGEYKLREGEFLGNDGLPYCVNCKKPHYVLIPGMGDDKNITYVVYSRVCECVKQSELSDEERRQREDRLREFRTHQELSMLGKRYQNVTFKTAVITPTNEQVYNSCKNYVAHAADVYKENIGLYVYGDNSAGKTHLTACICNALIYGGWSCIYTNFAMILNAIKASYNGDGDGEQDIINKLTRCQFAFIDDFGKEFIGREHNAASSKWAEEKLFEVINARYNSAQPTIFSSNYSISELASVLKLDKAIVERVNEIATRTIRLNGDDFRRQNLTEKKDLAKKLGI